MTHARRRCGRPALTVLLVGAALSGCGAEQDTVGTPAAPAPDASAPLTTEPQTDLTLELVEQRSGPVERFTLSCDPPGGEHPDPDQACADLAREPEPFAPLRGGGACTEIYGGPATATISGTYRDQQVSLELSRTDGCRIAQWDRLGAFLPAVAGAE